MSIGEAWDSLELDLNVMEAENIFEIIQWLKYSVPYLQYNRMGWNDRGREGWGSFPSSLGHNTQKECSDKHSSTYTTKKLAKIVKESWNTSFIELMLTC